MSDTRGKKRRVVRGPSARRGTAERVARSADAVLSVEFEDVALSRRTTQVIVGLCRAAFAQSKAIAVLARAHLRFAAAPNCRLFWEVALRLHWLEGFSSSERLRAVDTMLEMDRQDTNRILDYLRDAEHEADFDPTKMNILELDNEAKGALHHQATRL